MTQTSGRLFDEMAKMMTNAAGAAQGLKSEVESVMRGQAEKLVADMDLVSREEFDAIKAMAQLAREENEQLKDRLAVLEARFDEAGR